MSLKIDIDMTFKTQGMVASCNAGWATYVLKAIFKLLRITGMLNRHCYTLPSKVKLLVRSSLGLFSSKLPSSRLKHDQPNTIFPKFINLKRVRNIDTAALDQHSAPLCKKLIELNMFVLYDHKLCITFNFRIKPANGKDFPADWIKLEESFCSIGC